MIISAISSKKDSGEEEMYIITEMKDMLKLMKFVLLTGSREKG